MNGCKLLIRHYDISESIKSWWGGGYHPQERLWPGAILYIKHQVTFESCHDVLRVSQEYQPGKDYWGKSKWKISLGFALPSTKWRLYCQSCMRGGVAYQKRTWALRSNFLNSNCRNNRGMAISLRLNFFILKMGRISLALQLVDAGFNYTGETSSTVASGPL